MIRTIFSLGFIVFMVALVSSGTIAFFSDTESSTDNTFTAGAIDLKIDNESYYNGAVSSETTWELADLSDGQGPGPNGAYLFFNFLDVKPDDEGEDTISIHVDDNPAWACMDITITSNDENGCTEPEALEDGTCDDPGADQGELAEAINFVWWADDGDNVLENDESDGSVFYGPGSLASMTQSIVLADANGQGVLGPDPLDPDTTYYVAKAWCYGDLTLDPVIQDGLGNEGDNGPLDRGTGIECDGTGLGNETQTDSVTGDISFEAVQTRHNLDFTCTDGGGIGCSERADVMLVLDRSGSVSGDLTTLKDAAKAFVAALAPSEDGVRIGVASFGTTASLDLHLSSSSVEIDAAIDALISSGSTNLSGGISIADTELDNPGDGHDRDDADSPDFMVIITDGEPNVGGGEAGAETAADAAKADGIEIFAVGVDISQSNADFLRDDIVSPVADDHYFDAADFGELESILEDLTMCPDEITT